MKQIVITGSLSYDYIMNFSGRFRDRIMTDKLHVISLSFLVDTLKKQYGGTAVNQAYTLKLLGIEPTVITAAGNDFSDYLTFLKRYKIPTDGISVFLDEPCSSYHVVTDSDDNQIGAFYIGASKYNKTLNIPHDAAFVVIGPTDPAAMIRYVRQCKGKRYLYDPAFQIGNFSTEELHQAIKHAEILIGNDYEIALIKKKTDISVPVLITTLGSKGSIIQTKRDTMYCKPAIPNNTSDPTGAGDAYRAGFLAGYLRNLDLQTCAQMGSVAAVYTVEKYGTQTHLFTKNEFIKRYSDTYHAIIRL